MLSILLWSTLALGQNYDALPLESSQRDAVDYKRRADFFTTSDTYFVDGSVTSLPTESVTYDRTLFNQLRAGGNFVLTPNIGLRLVLAGSNAFRKEEGKQEPRKITSELRSELKPEFAFTYLTQTGLEVVFGLAFWMLNAFDRNSETDTIRSVESVGTASLSTPYLGVVKRSGGFDGGFFYKLGADRNRKIRIVTNQTADELTFSDQVHDPTTVGLFTRIKLGVLTAGGSFEAVAAGEGGTRTDNGDTVSEDYLRFRLEAKAPLGAIAAIFGAVTHRTLSYADNRNVTFTSMPMTVTHLRIILGSAETNSFVGIMYGTGKDGQSLPEFNADYKLTVVGGSLGLNLTF